MAKKADLKLICLYCGKETKILYDDGYCEACYILPNLMNGLYVYLLYN